MSAITTFTAESVITGMLGTACPVCSKSHKSSNATSLKCASKFAAHLNTEAAEISATETPETPAEPVADTPVIAEHNIRPSKPVKCAHTVWLVLHHNAGVADQWTCKACGEHSDTDPNVKAEPKPAEKPAWVAPDDTSVSDLDIAAMVERADNRRNNYVTDARLLADDVFLAYHSGAWRKVMKDGTGAAKGTSAQRYATWKDFCDSGLRVRAAFGVRLPEVRKIKDALLTKVYESAESRDDICAMLGMGKSQVSDRAKALGLQRYDVAENRAESASKPATTEPTAQPSHDTVNDLGTVLASMTPEQIVTLLGAQKAFEVATLVNALATGDLPAEPVASEPVASEPVASEPASSHGTIGREAAVKPVTRNARKGNGRKRGSKLTPAEVDSLVIAGAR
jgi:hypothetical protein